MYKKQLTAALLYYIMTAITPNCFVPFSITEKNLTCFWLIYGA